VHDERGGEKENRGCAAREVGEGEAGSLKKQIPKGIVSKSYHSPISILLPFTLHAVLANPMHFLSAVEKRQL
jgi:hypothetical protein